MAITTTEGILRVLSAFNPWWKTGEVHSDYAKSYRRFAYYEAMNRLDQADLRRVVMLTGARRVGKTTIQYQIIKTLLERGVAPERIVFVSLDHPMLKLSGMDQILSCYHENIYPDQDCYYLFDEIQYAADWDRWLKVIHDTQHRTAVVATGSASPMLVKGAVESGTGRWSIIPVPTLSFYEYCSLIGIEELELPKSLKPTSFLSLSRQEFAKTINILSGVQNHFVRYLRLGGFPELALSANDLLAQRTMREDIVDKVIKRDIPALFNIRNATELERIFLYLCYVSSNIVSIEAVSKELNGVSRQTVENYISYLESANLVYVSLPVEMGGTKVLKSSPKIYIADAAIRNAVLMDDAVLTDPVELGKMVETAVYKHVAAFYYNRTTRVGYYRGGKKDKEIDIVVAYPNINNMLIEVKYRENAVVSTEDAIFELCGSASAAIIVTKRAEDFGVTETPNGAKLLRIPAFAFLYLLGHAERHGYKGLE
ncbi:MAG TPA: ATP-binding protein [Clostridia bacterium]|nr:ATP-binding protein [Clostridia bacterium]